MARRLFITVAEVSGDQHAAHLIQCLRQLDGELIIEGHGGPEMRAAGAVIHHDTVSNAVMSWQAIGRAVEVFHLLKWTRRYFKEQRPDLLICIDSPAMNFHFAKAAHGLGIPVLYYIAPQLWAWREGRIKKVRKWVDHVACILPFEEQYFRQHGVAATFVGHPLFDALPPQRPPKVSKHGGPPVVGLLPGSRKSEAAHNFPRMLAVARRVCQAFAGARFLVPTTAATDPVVAALSAGQNDIEITLGGFDQVVPRCDLCITVSGTATLHVAGYGVPMLVVYSANPIIWQLVGRWLIRTRTYSLVNLLADAHEHIVPEFIPWYGSIDGVADTAIDYLRNRSKLAEQTEKLRRLVQTLDRPGASMNVARLAMDMIGRLSAQ